MDLTTAITTSVLFKKPIEELLLKFLGPSFEMYGEWLKTMQKNACENFIKILKRAGEKVVTFRVNKGFVPPRIAMEVLHEALFCNNDVMVEYYSGIFAASKTEDSNDDRLVPLLWLIKGMSSNQLRTHYIFYKIIYSIFQGNTTINIGDNADRRKCRVLIPSSVYLNSMERPEEDLEKIIDHCLPALFNKGLIEPTYCFGSIEELEKFCVNNKLPKEVISGIIIEPTCNGAELFLAAHGKKDILSSQIFEIPELISANDLLPIKGEGIPIFLTEV